MTDHDPRELELERELATLTEWNGPTPDLWREALHEASSGGWWQTVMTFGATRLRPTHLLAASLLVIVTIGIVYGLATPDAPSRPEYAASMAKDAASTAAPGFASPPALRRSALIDDSSESSRYGLGSEADLDTNLRSSNGGGGMRMRSPMASPDSGTSGTGSGALPGDRRVVRTVTVEL
ncbi:MAG: hypothetical protein KDA25_08850, partial [Phycisphaerales bacterium]|nr:hypothetical protein [Phycisphaerales bacterium]